MRPPDGRDCVGDWWVGGPRGRWYIQASPTPYDCIEEMSSHERFDLKVLTG